MSTTNMTLVVDRSYAEEHKAGFAVKPKLVSKKANVHMYLHHDGYPEWRGIELANWIKHMQEYRGFTNFADGSKYVGGLREGIYHDQGIYAHANGFKYIGEFRNGTFVGQILSDGNPTFWGSFDEDWTYYDEDGSIKITNLDNNWLQ